MSTASPGRRSCRTDVAERPPVPVLVVVVEGEAGVVRCVGGSLIFDVEMRDVGEFQVGDQGARTGYRQVVYYIALGSWLSISDVRPLKLLRWPNRCNLYDNCDPQRILALRIQKLLSKLETQSAVVIYGGLHDNHGLLLLQYVLYYVRAFNTWKAYHKHRELGYHNQRRYRDRQRNP